MKTTIKFFFLLTFTLAVPIPINGQSCKSGKLSPGVVRFLKMFPEDNRSAEELKNTVDFKEYKKYGPPAISYPSQEVVRLKVTADSIPIVVFNPMHGKNQRMLVVYHGGNFIQPLMAWMESYYWYQALTFKSIIVAVDYRVAPEHKFPAALNDSYNAFRWISENGGSIGGDTSNITLKGESAGGNLAAAVCQKAQMEGIVRRIKLQILISPIVDNPDHCQLYASMQENACGYLLTKASVFFAQDTYGEKKDYNNPLFAPVLFQPMDALPPALIITTEFDPLRDQAAVYAEKLKAAGVKTTFKCYPGHIHVFAGADSDCCEVSDAEDLVLNSMKE
jgi:acetyl esterase